MPVFYDIHTHKAAVDDDTISIVNLYKDFERVVDSGLYSIGAHPWYLDNNISDLAQIHSLAAAGNVLAIGECGLDRVCNTDWQLQLNVFRQQVGIATNIGKPLMIHCVKAYDELMATIDAAKPRVSVIIHGYNKKHTIANRLIDKGYYLSFGAAILNDSFPAGTVLALMSADRFFLETDDWDGSIKDIYTKAAELRKTTVDDIILQVEQNYKTVFNR